MKRLFLFSLALLVFIGLACSLFSSPRPVESISEEPQVVNPEPVEVIPTPTASPIPEPAFPKATYQDTTNNFEFDYPAGWAFDSGEHQSRGYYVQFYSWDWHPDDPIDSPPPEGTVLAVTVQFWDPKNDLEAFTNQRKLAWDSSGISILSEEQLFLAGDRPAVQFTVQGIDGSQGFFLLTTNGENYLVLSGNGDLSLLAEIARTLRPIR